MSTKIDNRTQINSSRDPDNAGNTDYCIDELICASSLDTDASDILEKIASVTPEQVQCEIAKTPGRYSHERLLTLISPAALDYLEQMALQARKLTLQRFGKTLQLYIPMYVSNFCINSCKYCGYNHAHEFTRTRLTLEQAVQEADVIADQGFRHILVLCGEDPKYIDIDYLSALGRQLRKRFAAVDIEIHPLDHAGYKALFDSGIDGITIYQETYNKSLYKDMHPAGPKSNYKFRLETPDRAANAGFRRLGLGALLGLADWRIETLALGLHADYLMKQYWRSQVSFSFPRLRPAKDVEDPVYKNIISDKHFVQMMLALRLCFADAGITISTRENAQFRKHLLGLCVTKMSAGSKTNPGGYSVNKEAVSQFEVNDTSTTEDVVQMVKDAGYEVVWKDWDPALSGE